MSTEITISHPLGWFFLVPLTTIGLVLIGSFFFKLIVLPLCMIEVVHDNVGYCIAQSREEAERLFGGKRICKYAEAKAGDIVISDNGLYVPLIAIETEIEKFHTVRGVRKEYSPWRTRNVWVFPKMRFRTRSLNRPFNYTTIREDTWGQVHSIARKTQKTLTPNKVWFAQLLANNVPPEQAIALVYPERTRKHQRIKLWEFIRCPQVHNYLFNVLGYMSTLKKALEDKGITADSIAEKIAEYIDDDDTNITLKKWALETAAKAIEEDKQNNMPVFVQINEGATSVKERLLQKASSLSLPHNTSQSMVGDTFSS